MSTRKSEQQEIVTAFLTSFPFSCLFFYQCQAKIVQKYHSPDNQPQYCVSFWNYP